MNAGPLVGCTDAGGSTWGGSDDPVGSMRLRTPGVFAATRGKGALGPCGNARRSTLVVVLIVFIMWCIGRGPKTPHGVVFIKNGKAGVGRK